ncbi:MAG TPA: TlpA disulfide reductase family protein [Casimicrobiaceae bacterium]|nr:TlpA disulfide reductase family protein [Casimicrobiaceae bacterium]
MERRRLTLVITAAAILALAAGIGTAWWMRSASPPRDASTLLQVALPDVDGASQPLGQWRGKILVVNFWATWCAPCREEMPLFIKAQSEHGAKGLQFVGIAIDDVDKVRRFSREIGLNYPALLGGYGAMELSKTLGNKVSALPFTIVVGRQGEVLLTQLGPVSEKQLERIIEQAVSSVK